METIGSRVVVVMVRQFHLMSLVSAVTENADLVKHLQNEDIVRIYSGCGKI